MSYSLPITLPPFECLAAALEALHSGSFSAAAERLGVSHAAISRRVAGAESWAGMPLFERHGRGVRPTLEGQRLLIRLQKHLEEIDTLVDRSRAPRARETVRLAVTPSFARYWIIPRLETLEAEDLHIELVASQHHADLTGSEADLAIRYGRGGWTRAAEEKLLDEALAPTISRTLCPQAPITSPKELLALPLLHNADAYLWRYWAQQYNVSFRKKWRDRVLGDYSLAFDAAEAGLGVALWNRALHPLPGHLRPLESFALSEPPLRHYLIRRDRSPSAAADRLAERLLVAAHAENRDSRKATEREG